MYESVIYMVYADFSRFCKAGVLLASANGKLYTYSSIIQRNNHKVIRFFPDVHFHLLSRFCLMKLTQFCLVPDENVVCCELLFVFLWFFLYVLSHCQFVFDYCVKCPIGICGLSFFY